MSETPGIYHDEEGITFYAKLWRKFVPWDFDCNLRSHSNHLPRAGVDLSQDTVMKKKLPFFPIEGLSFWCIDHLSNQITSHYNMKKPQARAYHCPRFLN